MIDVNKLYRLAYLIRYSNVQRIKNESVAEHSFFVCVEVIKLYESYKFNLGKALGMAIVHDFAESEIDDVNHQIKEKYPKVAEALAEAEKDIVKSYPQFVQDLVETYENDSESIEHKIVNIADASQCITYSLNEINLGNSEYMNKVYEESVKRVKIMTKQIPYACYR